ncbi:MAG: NADH:ubiquinone oxidoreductase [Prevotellaceae bacterium]|jgi:Ni,Fe-hydrogenase III small subunit|nr:NADH:ubiquinone oxidoreductase [Prevotellaceae bacterium]
MFPTELKILKAHGTQYIRNLKTVELHPLFRGRPELSGEAKPKDINELERLCPTGAISAAPEFSLDLGRCMFCGECQFCKPQIIRFTNDYNIATNRRENLTVTASTKAIHFDHKAVRPEIRKLFGSALKLRQVSAGGDNSCEMELNACGNVNFDMGRFGIEFLASPRHCDGIVVTGPVSQNMSAALQMCYDAVPEPKILILAGTEAISGGMFNNSPAIDRSFVEKYTTDLFVPGNPIHPLTFINGLRELLLELPLSES